MPQFRVFVRERWVRPVYVEADDPQKAVAKVLQMKQSSQDVKEDDLTFIGVEDPYTWVVEPTTSEELFAEAIALLADIRVALSLGGLQDGHVEQIEGFLQRILEGSEGVTPPAEVDAPSSEQQPTLS